MKQHTFFPYVSVYDKTIGPIVCENLINWFESYYIRQFHKDRTFGAIGDFSGRSFMEVNLNDEVVQQNSPMVWGEPLVQFMNSTLAVVWKQYQEDHGITGIHHPPQYGFEEFRMKRYLPEEKQYFGFHTDVGDHASAKRFLAFLWYLNDVEEGGETVFRFRKDDPNIITVKPKAGRVLVFPPTWTYPHEGLPPISGPKYVVSSYLHYL